MTLTNKLLLLVVSVILLTLVSSYYFLNQQIRSYLETSQLEWVDTLTSSLSESVAKDTINGNIINVHELLQRIVKDKAIEFAYVTDMNGDLFAHSFEGGFPRFLMERISSHSHTIEASHYDTQLKTKQGTFIEFDAPLIKGLTARIHIGINQSEVSSAVNSLIADLILFISLLAIMSISIAIVVGKRISMPLTDFSQKLLNYRSKDKNFPVITTTDPDINNLFNAFHSVIAEREQAETDLENEKKRLLLHRTQSPIGIIEWTTDFRILDFNPAAEKIFGYTKAEVLGLLATDCIIPESFKEKADEIWKELVVNSGGSYNINENITKDGKTITCEWHNTTLVNDDGKIVGVASYVEDITEHKHQEELIRRTQKMDALGKLTGGISHDFNNMLGVIMGYAELLQIQIDKDSKLQEYVNEIMHAGERGAVLTRKLLAFSKQKGIETQQVNLNSMIQENKNMLEKTLTARIKLVFDLQDDVWPINVDRNDLEDMILNMSINAMHATENTGQLSFKTRNEHLSLHDSDLLGIKNGDYVILTIADTGSGMDQEILEHIFEPFYTTKGSEGTGLGLSQVYGFVSRSRGAIKVYSEKDHGTQFVIYFPREKDASFKDTELKSTSDDSFYFGTEKILIVDDELSLRNLMKQILELKGYTVLIAENGVQALELLEGESVDLVLSDIIMPEMDGYQLANKLVELYPKLKIQLISGFTDNRHLENVNDELHINLLYKPINSQTLVKRIRELLDEE